MKFTLVLLSVFACIALTPVNEGKSNKSKDGWSEAYGAMGKDATLSHC